MAATDIVGRLIEEIQINKDDLNGLQYGEVSLIIQDSRVVRLEFRKLIKAKEVRLVTNLKSERSGPRPG